MTLYSRMPEMPGFKKKYDKTVARLRKKYVDKEKVGGYTVYDGADGIIGNQLLEMGTSVTIENIAWLIVASEYDHTPIDDWERRIRDAAIGTKSIEELKKKLREQEGDLNEG